LVFGSGMLVDDKKVYVIEELDDWVSKAKSYNKDQKYKVKDPHNTRDGIGNIHGKNIED
ncbi:21806_t:CDS:1, partial [Dentiscutata erythropus]